MARDSTEWQRLRDLLEVISAKGFDGLDPEQIVEFGKLYRRAAGALSYCRTRGSDPARLAMLNELVGRCYAQVYVAPRRPWPSVLRFFTTDFPQAVRRHWGWILLATVVSLLPAFIGYLLTWHDRVLAAQVLPPSLMAMMNPIVTRHHTPHEWMAALKQAPAASFIITNNIRIAITAFAGGMTAGLLTLLLLIYNGLMLGVIGAAVAMDGPDTALNFWAFAAPHGMLELPAIFISGGAGLLLGYALINPGDLPRRVALRNAGREALRLILGVAAMLVVAGVIEGFFSPRNLPEGLKLTVAGAEAVLFLSYLLFTGRQHVEAKEAAPFGELQTALPPV